VSAGLGWRVGVWACGCEGVWVALALALPTPAPLAGRRVDRRVHESIAAHMADPLTRL
jgi:hypothetical protein